MAKAPAGPPRNAAPEESPGDAPTRKTAAIRVEEEIGPISPPEFPTLSRVADRLDTEAEIGQSGAVRVYRIFDRTLHRPSAMKVLSPEAAKNAALARQFVKEAQITGQLDHPNVLPVHSLGVLATGALCFTMKLVRGETLTQKLEPRRHQPRRPDWIAEYIDIFAKVCDAVAFAHHHGVIHCDLKPDNVMVGDYGQVYLIDWGSARRLAGSDVHVPSTDQPAMAGEEPQSGTPSFMSPEQARGEIAGLDVRSDVFSLGAVLYFILSGRSPYDAVDEAGKLASIRGGAVTPLDDVPTSLGLSARLRAVTMRALSANPAARHQTATDLKNEVLCCLRGAPDLPWQTYKAGEHVVREGEIGGAAYVVRKGTCQAYKTVEGQKQVVRTMRPDDVFGELGILASKPRSASVVALEELTVEVVEADKLRDGLGMHTWLGPFVSALVDRFREADDQLSRLQERARPRDG
ncbi:MAG TPA: serine/threonine-protein kinase [Polyangia bacterium]|nr:serine/threonine-protein kinase [Polyangia bacterium]